MVIDGQGGIGIPTGTEPLSIPTPSPNMYGRDVSSALTRVGTTVAVSSTPLVDIVFSTVDSPRNPQYSPLNPLLCGVYPPTKTFSMNLLGYVTRSCCGLIGIVDPILYQSAYVIYTTSTVA